MGDRFDRTSGDIQADYRGPWMVGAMYALPLIGLGFACFIPKVIKDHPGDPWMPGLSYFLIGICAVAFACIYLGYRNLRVSIIGDRVLSTNLIGQVRIDCSVHDLIPGSFNAILGKNGQPETYEFQTTEGKVTFDAGIRNGAQIAARLQAISDGTAPPAHQTPAWTADPLSESEPSNIPLK